MCVRVCVPLRRDACAEVTDRGAQALAAALADTSGRVLPKLTTLGLDGNTIEGAGLDALARAMDDGAAPQLHSLYVDEVGHPALNAACSRRGIELSSW